MIYTVTLNPSLDYIIEVEDMKLGHLNRTTSEAFFPGGKGINVSQVLNEFQVENITTGFLGGFTGAFIENYLQEKGIKTNFVKIEDTTRLNIKLRTKEETEINAKGPNITSSELQALIKKVSELSEKDCLIVSGSIPPSITSDTYEQLIKICVQNKTKFIIDGEGELLQRTVSLKPFLIKPNHLELGQLFRTKIKNMDDAIKYGRKLIEQGVQNIIISLADKGAIFLNETYTLIADAPKGNLISSVGAGDSMVAAFTAIYEKTNDVEKAFQYSVAAGSATAFSLGLCTIEKIEELLPEVKIKVEK